MAHPQEVRSNVRRLYIEGMPLQGAALTCGVAYDTARTWKKDAKKDGDDWDTQRAAFNVGEQGIDALNKNLVEDFTRQALTTTRELEKSSMPPQDKATLMAQLADAYAKFSRSFARINPEYSGLSVALDTLKTLVDHLRRADPAALRLLQPHLDAVGATLGKRYGKK